MVKAMERSLSSVIVPIVAGLLGGALGGLVVGYARPATPAPRGNGSSINALAGDVDELAARVETLEKQVARLQQMRPSVVQVPVAAAGTPPEEGAPPQHPKAIDDPVFEAAVRDVVDRIQQERTTDREARMDERRQRATQQWADRFGQQLQLSDDQKAKVLAIAQEYAQKLRDLRDSDAGPASREDWRAQRDAIRDQSEQRLGEVLTPRQMQSYKASDDLRIDAAMRGGRGGGGRGFQPPQ